MNLLGVSLRDIEYVVAVADTGSFTAAADRCAVSQPALSTQVRKVEERLAVAIFERTGRAVRLTAAGAALVAQARIVLGEARRLFEIARGMQDLLSGPLHLGVIATLGPYLVPHLLGPLRDTYPDLRLLLREGLTADLTNLVVAGELDAVLLSLPLPDERLAVRPLFFEPFLGMCSTRSPLAVRDTLEMGEMAGEDLILMEEGHCFRDQALALCKLRGPETGGRHAASIETLRHLVAAGAGHSLLPKLAAREDPLLSEHLRYAPFEDASIGRTIALAWRATDARAAALQELADFLARLPIPGVVQSPSVPPPLPPKVS
jgi:LysR family transcriptional regulator, hydrogen peroxide-inducible genes activator